VAALLLVAALGAVVLSDAPSRFLVLNDEFDRADAAVVMAGDPGYERTATAARLFQHRRVRLVILTGGEPGPGDGSASLAAKAREWSVPADAIRTETVSHSTREAAVAVAPLLEAEGVRSVVLVTSPYHQRRAYRAALRSWPGVRILNHPAQPSAWSPEGWWRTRASRRVVVGEYLKLLYYLARGWA
jgi:uncharacterized SAM-binding protein YcdF (DUF218 family)